MRGTSTALPTTAGTYPYTAQVTDMQVAPKRSPTAASRWHREHSGAYRRDSAAYCCAYPGVLRLIIAGEADGPHSPSSASKNHNPSPDRLSDSTLTRETCLGNRKGFSVNPGTQKLAHNPDQALAASVGLAAPRPLPRSTRAPSHSSVVALYPSSVPLYKARCILCDLPVA